MNNKKLYKILKLILIILMIFLMIFILKFKTNDCAYCEFDLNDKTVKIGKFMDFYKYTCFDSQNHMEFSMGELYERV